MSHYCILYMVSRTFYIHRVSITLVNRYINDITHNYIIYTFRIGASDPYKDSIFFRAYV